MNRRVKRIAFAQADRRPHTLATRHIAILRELSTQAGAALSSLAAAGAELIGQLDSATGLSAQDFQADSAIQGSTKVEQDNDAKYPAPNSDIAEHRSTSNANEPRDPVAEFAVTNEFFVHYFPLVISHTD